MIISNHYRLRHFSWAIGFFIALGFVATSVFAQNTTGTIRGTVTGDNGAPIASAQIVARASDPGQAMPRYYLMPSTRFRIHSVSVSRYMPMRSARQALSRMTSRARPLPYGLSDALRRSTNARR